MLEIIPLQKLKIIPWSKEQNLIVLKRTKNRILFMGLERYLNGAKKRREERRGYFHTM